jgi:hypothetical protein
MENATLALVSLACFLLSWHKNPSDPYLQLSDRRLSRPKLNAETTLKSQAIVTSVTAHGDSFPLACFCCRYQVGYLGPAYDDGRLESA